MSWEQGKEIPSLQDSPAHCSHEIFATQMNSGCRSCLWQVGLEEKSASRPAKGHADRAQCWIWGISWLTQAWGTWVSVPAFSGIQSKAHQQNAPMKWFQTPFRASCKVVTSCKGRQWETQGKEGGGDSGSDVGSNAGSWAQGSQAGIGKKRFPSPAPCSQD